MKKILLITVFMVGLGSEVFSQVKIGVMNPAVVLAQLEEVQAIDEEIQELIATRDNQLLAQSAQLEQDVASYEQTKLMMTPEQQQVREQELLDRTQELENERESYINEIGQRRIQKMEPILGRLDAAIQQVAEAEGLDLVLNQATSYGDIIVFYTNEERLNITDQVLSLLTSE